MSHHSVFSRNCEARSENVRKNRRPPIRNNREQREKKENPPHVLQCQIPNSVALQLFPPPLHFSDHTWRYPAEVFGGNSIVASFATGQNSPTCISTPMELQTNTLKSNKNPPKINQKLRKPPPSTPPRPQISPLALVIKMAPNVG